MKDFLLVCIIVGIVAMALYYIRKEKKKGVKCIGCPFVEHCASKNAKSSTCKKN